MTNYLPPEEERPERLKISVRLEKPEAIELHVIAAIWNAVDAKISGKKRTKWKAASLTEYLVRIGIKGFWDAIGGKPEQMPRVIVRGKKVTVELNDSLVERSVDAVKTQRSEDSRHPRRSQ